MSRKEAIISISEENKSKYPKSMFIQAVFDVMMEPELAWRTHASNRGMPSGRFVTTTQTVINFFEKDFGMVIFSFGDFPKEVDEAKFPFKKGWSGSGWNYSGDLYVPVGKIVWEVASLKEW